MKRVVTILGTRPELIRLSRIIPLFDQHFDHILIHTGQNYDPNLSSIFFEDLGLREPDFYLNCVNTSKSLAIAAVIEQSYFKLRDLKPDAVFILGDTDSALSAISAKRLKIPVFHYEAGNRCFDFNVPEEINRRLVDTIADVNLCYSNVAKQNLINEGFDCERVFKVGSPMLEILEYYRPKIDSSNVLDRLKLEKNDYFVLSSHRSENVDDPLNLKKLLNSMENVMSKYSKRIIFPVHPRAKNNLSAIMSNLKGLDKLVLVDPMSFTDFVHLQINALCTFSDSGTITEEATLLDFNALNLRNTNERQEGFEANGPIMVGYSSDNILSSLSYLMNKTQVNDKPPLDYTGLDTAGKIFRIIQSYTEYIDRNVWKKITL